MRRVAYAAARAFDGTDTLGSDVAVLVHGATIAAVGPRAEVGLPAGTPVVELGQRTLLPGLVEAHTHLSGQRGHGEVWPDPALDALRAAADAGRMLRSGFTTLRDCGGLSGPALRRAVEDGDVVGPRIVAAGPMMSQTGGHADWHGVPVDVARRALHGSSTIVDGPQACRVAVREAVRSGSDLMKICTTGGNSSERDRPWDVHFTEDEVRAVVDEAHRSGRKVAAHAQGRDGILTAVRGGVDSIEHGYFLDETCVAEMLDRGTWLVPTFSLVDFFRASTADPAGLPPARVAKQQRCIEAMERALTLAYEAGIPMATGADAYGAPGREHGGSAELLSPAPWAESTGCFLLAPELLVDLGAPEGDLSYVTGPRAAQDALALVDELGARVGVAFPCEVLVLAVGTGCALVPALLLTAPERLAGCLLLSPDAGPVLRVLHAGAAPEQAGSVPVRVLAGGHDTARTATGHLAQTGLGDARRVVSAFERAGVDVRLQLVLGYDEDVMGQRAGAVVEQNRPTAVLQAATATAAELLRRRAAGR